MHCGRTARRSPVRALPSSDPGPDGPARPPIGRDLHSDQQWLEPRMRLSGRTARRSDWGDDEYGQASPPEDANFIAISSGGTYTCGLREDGEAVCWGELDEYGQASPPEGTSSFIDISTVSGDYTCGLREDVSAVCWGAHPFAPGPNAQASPPIRVGASSPSATQEPTHALPQGGRCGSLLGQGQGLLARGKPAGGMRASSPSAPEEPTHAACGRTERRSAGARTFMASANKSRNARRKTISSPPSAAEISSPVGCGKTVLRYAGA